jgi:hypothetical protein
MEMDEIDITDARHQSLETVSSGIALASRGKLFCGQANGKVPLAFPLFRKRGGGSISAANLKTEQLESVGIDQATTVKIGDPVDAQASYYPGGQVCGARSRV